MPSALTLRALTAPGASLCPPVLLPQTHARRSPLNAASSPMEVRELCYAGAGVALHPQRPPSGRVFPCPPNTLAYSHLLILAPCWHIIITQISPSRGASARAGPPPSGTRPCPVPGAPTRTTLATSGASSRRRALRRNISLTASHGTTAVSILGLARIPPLRAELFTERLAHSPSSSNRRESRPQGQYQGGG